MKGLANKTQKLKKITITKTGRGGKKNKQQQHTPAFLFQLSISAQVTHLDAAVWEGVTRRMRLLKGSCWGEIRPGGLKISYHWRNEGTGMDGLPSRSVPCGFSASPYFAPVLKIS